MAMAEAEEEMKACLHAAASNDVDTLISILPRWDQRQIHDENGNTPLILAAMAGHVRVVVCLLDNIQTIDQHNMNGDSPLLVAAQYGHADIVQLLLKASANVNHTNKDGNTALLLATLHNHPSLVRIAQMLIDYGINLDAVNNRHQTALSVAIESPMPNESFIRLLLDNGVDVNARHPARSSTILCRALSNKACSLSLLRLLLEHKADPNPEAHAEYCVFPMLCHAVVSDRSVQVIDLLLEYEADPNAVSHDHRTALHAAITFRASDIAERLVAVTNLTFKFNPCNNKPNALCDSCLWHAMINWKENTNLLRLMLQMDFSIVNDMKSPNFYKWPFSEVRLCPGAIKVFSPYFHPDTVAALLRACHHGNSTEILLGAGANANQVKGGHLPIFNVHGAASAKTMKLLWRATDNPSSVLMKGKTLIQCTVDRLNLCATQMLLRLSDWEPTFHVADLFWLPNVSYMNDICAVGEIRCVNKYYQTSKELPYLLMELDYTRVLNHILDQPSWFDMLDNMDTTRQWQHFFDVPQHQFDLLLQELQAYKEHFATPNHNFAVPNTTLGCIHTDFAVSTTTITRLSRLMKSLEPKDALTMGEEIVEIVDPDMYCVVFGETRFSQKPHPNVFWPGQSVAQYPPTANYGNYFIHSRTVQWLPTPVEYKNGRATFLSYINNIPWDYKKLYSTLEDILSSAMPLFEYTLKHRSVRRVQPDRYVFSDGDAAKMTYCHKHNISSVDIIPNEEFKAIKKQWKASGGGYPVPFNEPTFPTKFTDRILKLPFQTKSLQDTALPLQVIVHVRSYATTSKSNQQFKFTHAGTTWQNGSGLHNEPIVATAFVVYEMDNVAPVQLEMREYFEMQHTTIDPTTNKQVFTQVKCPDRSTQVTGKLTLYSGRLVCLPSRVQFRLSPFESLDGRRPGHVKILYLHLISPLLPILSTEFVAPQQSSWALDKILAPLPESIQRRIFEYLGHIIVDPNRAKTIADNAKEQRQNGHQKNMMQQESLKKRKRAPTNFNLLDVIKQIGRS